MRLDEKVAFCSPSAGSKTQLIHLVFTQPWENLLVHPCIPPSPFLCSFDVDDDFAVVRIDQPIMPSLPVAMAALEAGGRGGRGKAVSKQAEISFSETKALSLLPLTPRTHG